MEVVRAGDGVAVGQASSLHEGVDDRRANEAETTANHVLADGFRLGGLDWDFSAGLVVC